MRALITELLEYWETARVHLSGHKPDTDRRDCEKGGGVARPLSLEQERLPWTTARKGPESRAEYPLLVVPSLAH
jgi:hypothetical protein